jgi:hypothetical protein
LGGWQLGVFMIERRRVLALGVLGAVVVLVYLAAALGLIRKIDNLILALLFGIGPVAIVGALEIYGRFSQTKVTLVLRAGTVFLVVAFALFNLMLVVQQLVRLQASEMIAVASDEASKQTLKEVLRMVDLVQLGIDVSFDIFYCLGVILVSVAMYSHRDFGRIIGVFGVLSGAALLLLNLAAFPRVPDESGLVDLGPLTAVWWLVVIIQLMRKRGTNGAEPGPAV